MEEEFRSLITGIQNSWSRLLERAEDFKYIQISPDGKAVTFVRGHGPTYILLRHWPSPSFLQPECIALARVLRQMDAIRYVLTCPSCNSKRRDQITSPHDPYPTFQCQDCGTQYHQCPVHEKRVRGNNPYSLTEAGHALGDIRCTCRQLARLPPGYLETCFQ